MTALYTNKEELTLSFLDVVEGTTVDGVGFRTSLYAAGCDHRCEGCHNPESWNIEEGKRITVDAMFRLLTADFFANITFTGGDPLFQPEAFTELARRIKSETRKTIWCYTGYRYEAIAASETLSPLLPFLDVLVDGRFVQSLRDTTLLFRGSSNQRLIDVPRSLAAGEVVLWERNF